eukprot:5359768-Pleurochrysis_carterae.AAC.3
MAHGQESLRPSPLQRLMTLATRPVEPKFIDARQGGFVTGGLLSEPLEQEPQARRSVAAHKRDAVERKIAPKDLNP